MNESNPQTQVEQDVREAVERAQDVQDAVRRITLKALAGEGLDTEGMRRVARQVSGGIELGLKRHGEQAREVLEKAYAGFDEAFANAAEATTLAVKEAAGSTREFLKGDLVRLADDLKTLEQLYLDTLKETARQSRHFAGTAARHLAEHVERSGSAVGRQVSKSLDELSSLGHVAGDQVQQGVKSALNTGALMARAAAGVLAGMADRLEAGHKPDGRAKDR